MKKVKTFNRLDERFQLKPEHGGDFVFKEEKEMIREMKKKNIEFETLDDKLILSFLFSRRHDVNAATEVLTNHLRVKERVGFKETLPTRIDCEEIWKQGFIYKKSGVVDKHQRMIYYYFMEKDLHNRTPELDWKYAFFDCYDTIESESLSNLRNGAIYIVDMQNFGWRNLDFSSRGRENSRNMTGLFPKRMRALYVINAGILFMAALKAAKLILPKKIHKRIRPITLNELRDLIPEENLHPKYGGKLII